MKQEAADEFHMRQRDRPFWAARLFPPGRKGDLRISHGTDSAVGDGDFMRIAPKILDGIAKAAKGFLYVGAPVFGIEEVFKFLPFIGIP